MKTGTIYLIENQVNGKCYVGKTTRFERRMYEHSIALATTKLLSPAIRKHGWENFTVQALHEDVPIHDIDWLERHCIWLFNSTPPYGYNLTLGGEGGLPTEETRAKQSESAKKRCTPEWRQNMSEFQKQRCIDGTNGLVNQSEESRERTVEAQRERVRQGTHNFQTQVNPQHIPEVKARITNAVRDRVRQGTHNFVGDSNPNARRLADGTHNFLDPKVREKARTPESRAKAERTKRRNKGQLDWVNAQQFPDEC